MPAPAAFWAQTPLPAHSSDDVHAAPAARSPVTAPRQSVMAAFTSTLVIEQSAALSVIFWTHASFTARLTVTFAGFAVWMPRAVASKPNWS